jgi:energy-coupling factor transport system ATP-binding protein
VSKNEQSALEFRNFSYAYQGNDIVLDNINLAIDKGAFVAVTGPSGAGKTTFCLAVCGVVPHYHGGSIAGEVVVEGVRTIDGSMADMAVHVGTVLEDYESQLVTMTVEEEVAFALESRGLEAAVIRRRIGEILGKVGLANLEKREVSSLSGGQRQRLAIASVLATQPGILVLDEPASALDPEGAEEIYALLGALNREYGITVVVVEHDLSRVLAHASQFILLQAGRLLRQGSPEEVFPYMRQQEDLRQMLPPLWAVKFDLEQDLQTEFAGWRQEDDAVDELAGFLAVRPQEGYKSA